MGKRISDGWEVARVQAMTKSQRSIFRNLWRRKVPQIMQMSSVECGAVCLAMILSYYGCQTSVFEIRERCGVGRDALSALSIVKVARTYGLRDRAISLPTSDFSNVRLPAIIHLAFDHFLVVERWSPRFVDVVDPALGRMRLSAEEFKARFSGVVIQFEPGVHFVRRPALPSLKLRTYVVQCFKRVPWTFVKILVASLLLQLCGLALPFLTEVVVDYILPLHRQSVMVLIGAGILILFLSQLVTALLRANLQAHLQLRITRSLMLSFFAHLLALPLRFFQLRSSGVILARLKDNAEICEVLSNHLVSIVLDGSLAVVYLLLIFWLSSIFGLLVLTICLLQVLLLFGTSRLLRELSMRELVAQDRSQGYATEALMDIVSLKSAGAEQHVFQHWLHLFLDQLNVTLYRHKLSSSIDAVMTLLRSFSPLALLWMGTIQVLYHAMPLGRMLALNALAITVLNLCASLVSSGQRWQLSYAHLERLADVLEAEPEQATRSKSQVPRLTGRVVLKDVCFRYSLQSPAVLQHVTLSIEPGQRVAIVGSTGSGKSTLGKLLLGLYPPTQGEILYDGIPLHALNYQAVRAQFGVVTPETTLFSGTIWQNIALNDPAMDMESVIRAAKLAAVHDDIQSMPMGYETFIPKQGGVLSEGQRQRIVLARALAHLPMLFLLDEAAGSLDITTGRQVDYNLSALACTQIIITNRLSTIQHADMILVLDKGTIVEHGPHQELLSRNGYYTNLLRNQFAYDEAETS
jgi:ATP-binding cassette subfamily B protein